MSYFTAPRNSYLFIQSLFMRRSGQRKQRASRVFSYLLISRGVPKCMVRVTSVVPSLPKERTSYSVHSKEAFLKYETGEDVEKIETSCTDWWPCKMEHQPLWKNSLLVHKRSLKHGVTLWPSTSTPPSKPPRMRMSTQTHVQLLLCSSALHIPNTETT